MAQAFTWIITGILVGWVVRTAMKSGRDYGLFGDLVTGSLGAVVGSWVVRQLGIVTPDNLPAQLLTSVLGAGLLLGSVRLLRRAIRATHASAGVAGTLAGELEDQIRRLTALERRALSSVLGRGTRKHPNIAFEEQLTVGQRVADRVATFGGSWTFIGLFLTAMLTWMAVNGDMAEPFDPYPYILLNLMLSCVAALQAPVIMMSQHRQSVRDREDAKNDYEVNLRAEMQIGALHQKLDAARDQEWTLMTQLLTAQSDRLRAIEEELRKGRAS